MKKRNLTHKEQDQLQRLQRENEKLKRTIQSLRKQMSRIDIDQYQNLREIIESQDDYDSAADRQIDLDKLKRRWECHGCGKDFLRLIVVPRIDGMFYFRRCPTCLHKTKLKRYSENIEGIEGDNIVHPKAEESLE